MSGRDTRTKRRISRTLWLWLKRATIRDPSGSRNCSDVDGLDSSTPFHSPAEMLSPGDGAALVDAPVEPPNVLPVPVKYLRMYPEAS